MFDFISKLIKAILMNVYTQSKVVRIDLLPSGAAYSANDVVGTVGGSGNEAGKIKLVNALREPTRSAVLQSLTMFDLRNQKPALSVLIYGSKPSFNAPDNGPVSTYNDEPVGGLLGVINIAATDWVTLADAGGNRAFVTKSNLGIVISPQPDVDGDTNPDVYAVFITTSTPDWDGATVGELQADFGFLQD